MLPGFACGIRVTVAPGGGGEPADTYYAELTIASGEVASNLTDFVVMVDLSDMPAGFWSHVRSDGGDVRVYQSDGTTQVPFDFVSIDTGAATGLLFFKSSLLAASDNVFRIGYGNTALELLAPTATYGRNAVWSDYHRVFVFDELVDRTGSGNDATIDGVAAAFDWTIASTSPDLNAHQGVCWDGTYYYVTDTNRIKKYNSAWVLQVENTNPLGDSGISGVDHCGDLEVHGGLLYIPIETYPNSPYDNQHIAVFDADDLSFVSSYDISAQGHEVSSIAYNPADSLMYVTDFTAAGDSVVHKYDPANSFSYEGTLTLSQSVPSKQGITFLNSKLYINSDVGDRTYRFALDGTFENIVYSYATFFYEGLGHTATNLLVLVDGAGAGQKVQVLQEAAVAKPGWLNTSGAGHAVSTGLTKFTQWSVGASAVMTNKTSNRSVLSYTQADSSTTSLRATLVYRQSASVDRWGLWNSIDSWLTGGSSPTLGQTYHLNATHNGTADRKLYINGSAVTDTGAAQRPAGTGDGFFIGSADVAGNERFVGSINYAYLRNGVLSADWIAAESVDWLNPSDFYTIGAEQVA